MQAKNFVQLTLPLADLQMNPLNQMENAIQAMLNLTWNCVLAHISVRTTKQLMQQHGKLIALNDRKACIQLTSTPVFRLAKEKLPDVEAAFKTAFGTSIKIRLEVRE